MHSDLDVCCFWNEMPVCWIVFLVLCISDEKVELDNAEGSKSLETLSNDDDSTYILYAPY